MDFMGNEDNQVQRVRVRRRTGISIPIDNNKEISENPIFYSDDSFKYMVIGPFKLRAHEKNKPNPAFNSTNSDINLKKLRRLDYMA